MAWLAKNKYPIPLDFNHGETEVAFQFEPKRDLWGRWITDEGLINGIFLPDGTIKKILGRDMIWEDEPVEI